MPAEAPVYNAAMPDRPPADGSHAEQAGPSGARSASTLSLANHFLIAMPSMADSRFADTVVYLLEHTPERAMGVVINRPTDLTLEKLFERVDMKLEIEVLGCAAGLLRRPDGDRSRLRAARPVRRRVRLDADGAGRRTAAACR